MKDHNISRSIDLLEKYVSKKNYKGYDPYDTLNSVFPFQKFGKWIPILATQFQKRNPVNIRPLLGIKEEANPKGLGLFLNAFIKQYNITEDNSYLEESRKLIEKILSLRSDGYSNFCWGYNFPWASPLKTVPSYHPSVVPTAFIVKGLYQYYSLTKEEKIKNVILSTAKYVMKDLPRYETVYGICFSYTDIQLDVCYNANLLGAEILSYAYVLTKKKLFKELATEALNFTVHHQYEDGHWNYSLNTETGEERKQIDFHQGYILESANNIIGNCNLGTKYDDHIIKGLVYYRDNQFFEDGRSLWRVPQKWPIEIHNQSQGIITFTKLSNYHLSYSDFARTIAEWTINNMQDEEGYFYYQKHRFYTNKIPYMRWSQAWMLLALTDLMYFSR